MTQRLARGWILLWFVAAIALTMLSVDTSHDLPRTLRAPEPLHPLGFDAFGRDLLAVLLKASLLSAGFAAGATLLSCLLGVALGLLIAMAPRRIQFALLRTLETFLAFPSLLLALAWAAVSGPGWDTLIVALCLGTVPGFARLIYARTRELLVLEYVTAARAVGAGPLRLAVRHLSPALVSLCRVKLPNLFAHALLAEATLSFLGVGAPVGRDTWGALLAQGRDYLVEAPHVAWGVGATLVLTVLALQLISESLSRTGANRL